MGRSASYPGLSLEDCVELITAASKSGAMLSDDELAGFTIRTRSKEDQAPSTSSGAFIRRKAALKAFGLIEPGKETNAVTSLARAIVAPETSQQRTEAIKTAFLQPDIFKGIFEQLSKGEDLNVVLNIANKSLSHGITMKSKDRFAKVFVESGIYAGLIEDKGENTVQIKNTSESHSSDGAKSESTKKTDPNAERIEENAAISRDVKRIDEKVLLVQVSGPKNIGLTLEISSASQVDLIATTLKQLIALL